jgi:hypothetical protein
MNAKIATENRDGLHSGKMILTMILNVEHPSILAASSSSFGMDTKYVRRPPDR